MSGYETDEYGIPVVAAVEIEEKAEEFLGYFDPALLTAPKATPVARICQQ